MCSQSVRFQYANERSTRPPPPPRIIRREAHESCDGCSPDGISIEDPRFATQRQRARLIRLRQSPANEQKEAEPCKRALEAPKPTLDSFTFYVGWLVKT